MIEIQTLFGISVITNIVFFIAILIYRGSYIDENKWKCEAHDREERLKEKIFMIKCALENEGLVANDNPYRIEKITKNK